jgi:mRNA interferase MazF
MVSASELWLTDFGTPFPGEPAYHRPAVVVGPPSHFGPDFPFIFVVPVTTTNRGLSLHVEIEANETTGLDTTSFAQCELLRSVNRRRAIHRIGSVDATAREQISKIIATLLNL